MNDVSTVTRDTATPETRAAPAGSPTGSPTGSPGGRTRSRRWRVLIVLLLLAGGGYGIWHATLPPPAATRAGARPGVPVMVAPVRTADVPVYLAGLGTVQAYHTVTVRAMVDGPLISVNFREGQDVKKGDVLARIDPRTYQAAYDQAVAKKAQDEAQLANAKLDLARYEKLARQNYTTGQTADTQRATVAQLEAQVRQDQAAIDSAATQLSYTTITAPIDGRTGIRQVDAGNIVHSSDTTGIVVITTLKPIAVLFSLPQQDLPAISAAMAAGAPKVLALDSAGKVIDTGTLRVIDNQVDSTTGTIKLKADFPNPGERLWPGAFVNVKLLADTLHNAIVVPPAAVQRGRDASFVYVLKPDSTVERRTIVTGHEDETATVITGGLKPGEQVVIDGASRISDGSRVTVDRPGAPGASPAGGTPAGGTRAGGDRAPAQGGNGAAGAAARKS